MKNEQTVLRYNRAIGELIYRYFVAQDSSGKLMANKYTELNENETQSDFFPLPDWCSSRELAYQVRDKVFEMGPEFRARYFQNLKGFVGVPDDGSRNTPSIQDGIDPIDICYACLIAVGWRG